MNSKINKPCYFYNTGGCYNSQGKLKSDGECKYLHVKVQEPLEKPQHLKAPCKFFHLRGCCKNPYCVFGHVELSKQRWEKYFSSKPYPGSGYSSNYIRFQIQDKIDEQPADVKSTLLLFMLKLLNKNEN